MILFDTNALLDIATADPVWLPWSEKEFRADAALGPIGINPIIYAELAPAFATAAALDQWLEAADRPAHLRQSLPEPGSPLARVRYHYSAQRSVAEEGLPPASTCKAEGCT
jgi:hypothetical protein